MDNIENLLLAINEEARAGCEECQRLLDYHWKTPEDCMKALLLLYTAYRIDQKMPHIFSCDASQAIELTENGKWDDALWQLYPATMNELYST